MRRQVGDDLDSGRAEAVRTEPKGLLEAGIHIDGDGARLRLAREDEQVTDDADRAVGYVTSAAYGYTIGKGIAYAWLGAARGFPVKLCMPENASLERKRILKALHDGGVPVIFGTDAPQQFSIPGFSLHRELLRMRDGRAERKC